MPQPSTSAAGRMHMSGTGCIPNTIRTGYGTLPYPLYEHLVPRRVPGECPEGALELVRRCLRLNPQERPTAAEAAEAIDALEAAPAPRMQARRCMLQLYQCSVTLTCNQD